MRVLKDYSITKTHIKLYTNKWIGYLETIEIKQCFVKLKLFQSLLLPRGKNVYSLQLTFHEQPHSYSLIHNVHIINV